MHTLQRFVFRAAVSITLAVGCGGTTASIEQSWRSPSAQTGELTNVVTFCPSRSEPVCRSAEDQLAHELAARGVRAVPSHNILTSEDLKDRSAAIAKLRRAGFNGVIAMRFVGAEQKLDYYTSFDYYWGSYYTDVIPTTILRVDVSAYRLADGQLVWSASTKSVDPEDVEEVVDDVTKVVGKELAKQRIVGATMSASK